jgi:hypothetical protein
LIKAGAEGRAGVLSENRLIMPRMSMGKLVLLYAAYFVGCHSLMSAQLAQPALAKTQNVGVCLPSSSSVGEQSSSPQVTVAELLLEGDLHMAISEQERIAASLKRREYSGSPEGVASEVAERVRAAWQNRGYFKVEVQEDTKTLTSGPGRNRIAVAVQVVEGPQYRLEKIAFKNNRAISNAHALRSLFPIKDGDIFSREQIAKGLENLGKAYGDLGYIDLTSIPSTHLDDARMLIGLDIDIDEGKQFLVRSVNVLGLDENVSRDTQKDLLVRPGDIYNRRLATRFVRDHISLMPPNTSPESRIHLKPDEKTGIVVVTFDFRFCPTE